MKRSLMLSFVFGLTTVWVGSSALAQKADGQDGGRGAAKGDKGGKGEKGDRAKGEGQTKKEKGGKGNALQSIGQAMTKELNLTEKQQTDIKKLFADYEANRAKSGESEALKKEAEEIKKELKDARKNKDEAKAKEVMQKMKALRKESPDNAVDPKFLESVAKKLDDKQQDPFWEIVARYTGEGGGALIGKYTKALSGLGLSAEQKKATDKILQKFEEDTANLDKTDREKSKAVISKLRDDLNAQLDADQQVAFNKALKEGSKGEKGDKKGKGHDGGKEARGGGGEGKGGGRGAGAGGKGKAGQGGGGKDD